MEIRRRVGILHDKVALPPEVTVGFFLEKVGEIYDVPKVSVVNTLSLCGLLEVSNQAIGTLSLGYTKRLGIAQAVLHNPNMVIADEPFTQLDPMTRIHLRELFLRLKKDRGISFFVSSHDIFDLEQIADYFAVINKGRIARQGSDFGVSGVLVKASANDMLALFLKSRGYDAFEEGTMVRVNGGKLNEILGLLAQFDGKVYEVKSSSLESILRDAVIE